MALLSKLIGKTIKGSTGSGLRGSGRTAPIRTKTETSSLRDEPLTAVEEADDLFSKSPDIPPTPAPPITPVPTTTSDKQVRMMMLQGAEEPIVEMPPITPIETPQIRADIDVVPPVREEMDKLMPPAGGRGGGKGGGGDGDGIDFAGQRFSKAPDVDESKDALELADIETVQKGDFKTPRKKDLQKAARQLEEGTITGKQYRQIAKEQSPIEPFTEVPEPATFEKIAAVLKGEGGNGIKKLLKGIIGFNRNIKQGEKVLSRLDIPAYNNFNTWIATVTHKGKSMYGSTAVLKNVEFKPHTTPSLKIAKGEGGKEPFATMRGNWQNTSSKDIRKFVEDNDILEKSLKYEDKLSPDQIRDVNEEWVQVGFNPERHGFFYHKSGKHKGRPIFEADEMIQIGALVLARNPKKPSLTQLKKLKVKGVNAIFNKGGVVDMRNGGRVGAAVVAASLMASGGQAISNQMDQLMSEGGEIQHMKGLPLDIFNRHFTRLVKSGLADPEYRQQALQNFDKFTDEVFKIESSKNWKAKNRLGYKGGFRFGKSDMDMTLNRLQRNYKDKWMEDARTHGDASQLTPEQQTALFVTNLFDKTLQDSEGNKLTGEGDRILSGVLKDDKGSMIEAYERLHYADTDKLDLPTKFRTNVILRFGDDWENRIFGWAKKAKDIKNKYLN